MTASTSRRWASHRRQVVREERQVPKVQCTLSVVAESRPQKRLGRSPGSEVQSMLCDGFTFPGSSPSGRSKPRPHSQWRDRAGFAPDFPVMPLAGTQTRCWLYHERGTSSTVHGLLATSARRIFLSVSIRPQPAIPLVRHRLTPSLTGFTVNTKAVVCPLKSSW